MFAPTITHVQMILHGAPRSYPQVTFSALRAIHLGAPYGITVHERKILHHVDTMKHKNREKHLFLPVFI